MSAEPPSSPGPATPSGSTPPVAPEAAPVAAAAALPTGAGVEVFVADEQDVHPVDTDRWLRLAVQVLAAEGVTGDVEMNLLFVDESTIASYNKAHLGKDGPTDVLSFPIDEGLAAGGRDPDHGGTGPGTGDDDLDEDDIPMMLGDVLICPAVAARNAPARAGDRHDGGLDDELALLVVHGLLHLLSYDHIDDAEAEAMEAREQLLLDQFHRAPGAPGDEARGA